MVVFVTHEPHATEFVYYSMDINGASSARNMGGHGDLAEWFHFAALVWMTFHGIYLADLTNRQMLESKRFQK